MFSRLSRLHINLQFIVVALGALLIWAAGFTNPQPALPGSSLAPLYDLLFGWTMDWPLAATLIAFLLSAGTALLWHYILVEEGLLARNNLIPVLVTMLIMAYSPFMMRLNASLPANFLLILAIRVMMRFRHRDEAYQDIFTAGILLGGAVLFNPWYVLLLPLVWIALQLFRVVSFREWLISLLGFLTPLLWLAFGCFWNNQLEEAGRLINDFFLNFRLFKGFEIPTPMTLIILGALVLLFLPAFFRFAGQLNEKLIALRKCSHLMIWIFLLGILIFASQQSHWFIHGSVILLPASLFISAFLISVKKKRIPEILLALFVAAVIVGRFIL